MYLRKIKNKVVYNDNLLSIKVDKGNINFLPGQHFSISIKEKFIKRGTGRSGYDIYHLVDSNDNIYQIRDVWFKGEFDTADDYVKIKEGKTYKVVGYGSRVRMLSWYPILYKFTEV